MLYLSNSVRYREEDFGGIVFRKEDNFFIQINKAGYQLINSFQNPSNIIKVMEKYPKFFEYADLLKLFSETPNRPNIQFKKADNHFNPDEKRLFQGYLSSPLEVGIEITSACQLTCAHCYGAFNTKKKENELSTHEIFGLIDHLAEIGNFAIFVGGGEPTLHPQFFEICDRILKKDMNVVVSSNGVGIDSKTAKRFLDLGGYVGVQISLEGPNPEINDLVRGHNSFNASIRGLKNLQDKGLVPTIGTTITKVNYKHIEDMIIFANSIGVPHIHFMCLMPSGRGNELYEKLKLSVEQRIWLTQEVNKLKNRYKDKINFDCANFYQQPPTKDFNPEFTYDKTDRIYAGCEASRVKANITSTGDIIGCEIIRDYIAGNIRKDSFSNIWENSPVFKEIRSRNSETLEGKCKSCKYITACVGDCPSYSIHLGKSFFLGGEECPHEPKIGNYKILD